MTIRPCSECGTEIEILRGRPPKVVCGKECAGIRANRLRGVKRRADIPTVCSECGRALEPSPSGRPFVTCSAECFGVRNRRLKAERYAQQRDDRGRFCIDCLAEIPTVKYGHTARCGPCATNRRRTLERERRARQAANMKPGGQLSWTAKTRTPRERLATKLRSLYGIGIEDYEAMIEAQHGLCAICRNPPEGRGRGGTLVVDHCHEQGHVRGLLCGRCNIALGLLNDDPLIVDEAAAYLRRRAQVSTPSARSVR
jgi:hypothetical protein